MKQKSGTIRTVVKSLAILLAVYVFITVSFHWLAGDQLLFRDSRGAVLMPETNGSAIELNTGVIIEQTFSASIQRLESVSVKCGTYYRANVGTILMELVNTASGETLMCDAFDASAVTEGQSLSLRPATPILNVCDEILTLRLTSDSAPGRAAAILLGSQTEESPCLLTVNGEDHPGILYFSADGTDEIWTGRHYWLLTALLGTALALLLLNVCLRRLSGKHSQLVDAFGALRKYNFLIRQLVGRDFKAKYKRSVLGVFWSFLNPLLMMSIQYYVFSTIFKSDIPHFAAYLITGTVMYGFFTESCGMALSSILDNAGLITKVYVPRYIYPLTRTMSSVINLGISMIPMLMVCLATGVRFQKAAILSLYFFLCLIVFCLGLGMLLSTSMVFFRDTQFLWGVASLAWMYATPIFYPEEIIPEHMRVALWMNPLYHFLRAARLCLLDGRSPEPRVYALCFAFAAGMVLLGAWVFRRHQARFVLYL